MTDASVTQVQSHHTPTASQVQYSRYSSNHQPGVQSSVERATLQQRLDDIVSQNETKGITTSVSLVSVGEERSLYSYNNSGVHFAASINKLPVALLILQDLRNNKISLDTTVNWTAQDVRGGYGRFDQAGAPLQANVRDLLTDMLKSSGNTAVRVLVNYSLGGAEQVNGRLAAIPELAVTRLQVVDPALKTFYLGNTTSGESLWTIQKLMDTSDVYQLFIRDALANNIFSYYGVRSQLEGNDFVVLANKVGTLDDTDGNNRHDVGIIYNTRSGHTYGYSFLTTTPGGNIGGTAHAEHSLDLLGRQTLRYAGDKPGKAPKPADDVRSATPERRVRY